MVILGRECGLAIEMQQVTVQSLVPPQLADAKSAEEFMQQLPQVLSTPLIHPQTSAAFQCCPVWWNPRYWPKDSLGWSVGSVCLSVCLSLCLSVSLSLSVSLPDCLPACLFVWLCACVSVSSWVPVHTCPPDPCTRVLPFVVLNLGCCCYAV